MQSHDILKALENRYAVKKFDSHKVLSPDLWTTLEKALILSPSSYGLQPWKFLVVTSPDTKARLRPASWDQSQVTDCSHYLVFTVLSSMGPDYVEKYIKRISEVRGVSVESLEGYKKMMLGSIQGPLKSQIFEWASRQAYIALGNLMTSAAVLGVDTCPMEGFEREKYDEILGLNKTAYRSVVCCAVGYRSADDAYASAAKVRFGAAELVQRV